MATYTDREAFIPYRRTDLVELCLEDGRLGPEQAEKFKSFCEILAAYYHFELHQLLEQLKENFAPFNPDADTKTITEPTEEELREKEHRLVETFKTVLERANFNPLSQVDLEQSFETASLIDLQTKVDFDDFDQMIFYHRGDVFTTTTMKKFFRKVEVEIDIFERVALLLKFKDQAHFEAKKAKLDKLNFTPGKTYIYLYKNIPRHDLEVLFPNVEVSMNWKDRLLFVVPALGAAVGVLFKALPQIILIVGVVLFFTLGPQAANEVGADEENVRNIMPVLAALLTLVIALGGLAVKQYNTYKTKQIKFLKDMTDTLFFRNLSSNASVFHALIDAAEEEETKEIILVYYHLLTSSEPLTAPQLDDTIEQW
ncbi:MAG: DUF3754 domain-containing protein, partial [Anaerolineae bacterium]|nr:DUF3754 domain-containing protein [Anaerolineae bacterium]